MADVYKIIHPVKYFNDYLSLNVRPDGRKFNEHRHIKLNVDSLKTAESSAIVRSGNTTVVCGIKLELATPKAEEPENGFLITNVELPPLCSARFRPGPPSDQAQVISHIVTDIVKNSKCVDLKDLCIVPDKLAWVLYCDMVCLDYDGSVVDSCIITLMACLKTLKLPAVTYDAETEEIVVDDTVRTPLKIYGHPVATSFAVYPKDQSNIIITDPNSYEEEICGGNSCNFIVCCNKGLLCSSHKFGGGILSSKHLEEGLQIAKERGKLIEQLIDTSIKSNK